MQPDTVKHAVVVGAGRIGTAVWAHLKKKGYSVAMASHEWIELTDWKSVRHYFERLGPKRIDVLVNAAGGYGAVGPVRDVPPQIWRQGLDLGLVGVYACCHYAIPKMVKGSHIITFTGGGRGPLEHRSGLAAAKSGLGRLNETLAKEEPELFVNAIAPGPMYSRMHDRVLDLPFEWAKVFRRMKDTKVGEVSEENSLRAIDYLLTANVTGQLLFARDFWNKGVLYA